MLTKQYWFFHYSKFLVVILKLLVTEYTDIYNIKLLFFFHLYLPFYRHHCDTVYVTRKV